MNEGRTEIDESRLRRGGRGGGGGAELRFPIEHMSGCQVGSCGFIMFESKVFGYYFPKMSINDAQFIPNTPGNWSNRYSFVGNIPFSCIAGFAKVVSICERAETTLKLEMYAMQRENKLTHEQP